MKAILSRLFNHEELNREEAKNLLLNITKGRYNDSQIAALLTVFQMRVSIDGSLVNFTPCCSITLLAPLIEVAP